MMTSTIKALLVDDEANARKNLRRLLTRFCPEVEILGEAAGVDEAVIQIRKRPPDLVFLDIVMPEKSGFELLTALPDADFHVIFITAHDQYAVKAFEVSAIDYLLKLVEGDRLQKAVQKVVKEQQKKQSYKPRLEALRDNILSENFKTLAIRKKNGHSIVSIENIITIEADGVYTWLSVLSPNAKTVKRYLYSRGLVYFKTFSKNFIRVHRSWIINATYVQSYFRRNRSIVLAHNINVPLSKTYKKGFEDFMGF